MSTQWHMLHDGQQYGPYTGEQLVEFVKEGRIARESLLWAEGMAEWARADAIEGLFPAAPAPAPVLVAAGGRAPAAAAPPWSPQGRGLVTGGARPAMAASPYATPQTAMAASPYAMGGAFGLAKVPPGADYPPVDVKPTNFALIVGLAAGGIVLMALAVVVLFQVLKRPEGGSLTMVFVLIGAGAICSIIGSILQLIALYRGWACLQHSNPRTTPGKAVGFLFIPLFNVYWLFVAYLGLAKDWNRIMSQHPNLARMPRISEGLALTMLILVFAPLPLNLVQGLTQSDSPILAVLALVLSLANAVIWFIFLSQICRGVNSMAFRPTHAPGTFFIR